MATEAGRKKLDADYVFYELTRSVCPKCLETIDAQILIKDGRVIMRKRCPDHGWSEALISSDAEMYLGIPALQQAGHDAPGLQHGGGGRLPEGLRAVPRAQAAHLPGAD